METMLAERLEMLVCAINNVAWAIVIAACIRAIFNR